MSSDDSQEAAPRKTRDVRVDSGTPDAGAANTAGDEQFGAVNPPLPESDLEYSKGVPWRSQIDQVAQSRESAVRLEAAQSGSTGQGLGDGVDATLKAFTAERPPLQNDLDKLREYENLQHGVKADYVERVPRKGSAYEGPPNSTEPAKDHGSSQAREFAAKQAAAARKSQESTRSQGLSNSFNNAAGHGFRH